MFFLAHYTDGFRLGGAVVFARAAADAAPVMDFREQVAVAVVCHLDGMDRADLGAVAAGAAFCQDDAGVGAVERRADF